MSDTQRADAICEENPCVQCGLATRHCQEYQALSRQLERELIAATVELAARKQSAIAARRANAVIWSEICKQRKGGVK